MTFASVAYVPQLKWKAGERTALNCLPDIWRAHVLPLFKLCPPGGFEPDLGGQLDASDFLRKFGQHFADVCGRSPILVDGELLEGAFTDSRGAEPFNQLLTRARLAGALPIPVFRSSSSPQYVQAIRRYLSWVESGAACLRLEISELEAIQSRDDLLAIAAMAGVKGKESVLLVDGGPLSVSDEEGLTQLLAFHFTRLVRPDDWGLVTFSSTTFPERPQLKSWESGSFERGDWGLYRHIESQREEFPVLPVFSDYGLEFPGNYKPKPVRPSAHLRYSTENKYFIFKGNSVGKEDKYANIFRVAANLVNSGIFKGDEYSLGDAYIRHLAKGSGKTGHASKWRWCATDHHLTLVVKQLNSLLGLGIGEQTPHVEPDQLQLILP